MKEQGQVLCAGPAANPGEVHREAAETALARPWEPAARGLAGSRRGAGSEGPDVLLRAAGGEGLALPRRHPGPQPPGVTPTDRVHWSGARGLPLKTSFSAEFDGRRRCGPQPCPSLSCLRGLLSGKASPSCSAHRAPALPREGAARGPDRRALSRSSALTVWVCFFPKPHTEQREPCVAPTSLAHGGLFYDSVLETIGLGRNNTDAFASQEAREFPLLSPQ